MSSTRQLIALGAALLLLPAFLPAQTEPTSTTTTAPPEAQETTEATGKVPDELVGRWLAVADIEVPDGKTKPAAQAWEIRRGAEHLELVLLRGQMPESITQGIARATKASTEWKPDSADLRALAEGWGKTDPAGGMPAIRALQHKITGHDAFPPEYMDDELTKDAEAAIVIREDYAGGGPAIRTVSVYAVQSHTPDVLQGGFVTTTIAAAPLPIPITLKGKFKAYRVEPAAPAKSWLEKLFSGCQRG